MIERVNELCRHDRAARLVGALGLALSAATVLAAGPAEAAASPWWRTEQGAVRLVSASDAAGSAAELAMGLQFRMRPGWHIYWRSPGDAGFPPRPDWTGSANLSDVRLDWPAPERFTVLGLETLGYENEVVLPMTVAVAEPGKPVRLRARVQYLTCEEICIPYEAKLAFDLPAGPETSSREAGLIERFRALVPRSDGTAPLRIETAAALGAKTTRALEVRLAAATPLAAPDIFVEGPPGWGFGAPDVRILGGGMAAYARIAALAPAGKGTTLLGKEVRVTAVDGARSVERSLVLGAASAAPAPAGAGVGPGLIVILALAVLGGLILNLMPCVLPVLSLKLLSLVGHGGGEAREVRKGFLASAAGILVSFLVLGTAATALHLAGETAGWGIQFQQPVFLAVMAMVVLVFAANMFGLFEIRLPESVADFAAAAGGAHGVQRPHGMLGHFLTGAFATLLATPCSAPFLGTAVGFALARGPVEIYAVFLALGIGLALPYLAVAAVPAVATRMPRPGPWMVMLRRILGFALLATAVWLLTVLAVQTTAWRAVAVGLLLGAVLVAAWIGPAPMRGRSGLGIAGAAAAVVLVLAAWPAAPAHRAAEAAGFWAPFDRGRIASEVSAGRVVFVDVTADWCITCQVNKALVLDTAPIHNRLAAADVTAMKADWTRPNPAIAAYLASFGRYGIPFNAVYGPGSPGGIALPEVLTKTAVVDALARAGNADGRARAETAGAAGAP